MTDFCPRILSVIHVTNMRSAGKLIILPPFLWTEIASVTSEYLLKSPFWLEKWPRTEKHAEFGQKRTNFVGLGSSSECLKKMFSYLKLREGGGRGLYCAAFWTLFKRSAKLVWDCIRYFARWFFNCTQGAWLTNGSMTSSSRPYSWTIQTLLRFWIWCKWC